MTALLLALGSTVVATPTVAAAPAAAPRVVAATAASGTVGRAGTTYRASLVFEKNRKHQFRSTLTWRLWERRAGQERVVEKRSWRAGSGLPGPRGQDPCARSVGWAPNGNYRITLHHDYPGNVIKGRAFRMDNMACRNGTVRQNLFLHTEQGPGSRQCADARGDQACRWEVPRINDYKSNGCLKMAPGDLHELTRLFDRRFDAGIRYGLDSVVLRVVG